MSDWECQTCGLYTSDNDRNCAACRTKKPCVSATNSAPRDQEDEGLTLEYPKTQSSLNSVSRNRRRKQLNSEMTNKHELRIVLIGRTGCGKSATGNSILGENKFEAMVSGSSVTAKCSRGETYREHRLVLVVDTPGLFDTSRLNADVTTEIGKCVGITSPGPHAVLLVISIGRFTKEVQDTVDHVLHHFGSDVTRYMMIVFTREDSLKHDNKTIEEFLKESPPELQDIVRKCNNRYVTMNNHADEITKKAKVDAIISKIDEMVENNGGTCFTNETYEAVEEILSKRMQKIINEYEQEQEVSMATMDLDKSFTEMQQKSIQHEIAHLQSSIQRETDRKIMGKLQKQIESFRRRDVQITQQLQQKEKQYAALVKDLKQAQSSNGSKKSIRAQVRNDVERKSSNIFEELLESIKSVGKTFLSKAINFFTRK